MVKSFLTVERYSDSDPSNHFWFSSLMYMFFHIILPSVSSGVLMIQEYFEKCSTTVSGMIFHWADTCSACFEADAKAKTIVSLLPYGQQEIIRMYPHFRDAKMWKNVQTRINEIWHHQRQNFPIQSNSPIATLLICAGYQQNQENGHLYLLGTKNWIMKG